MLRTKKDTVFQKLKTPFEENLDINNIWKEYPRPQLKRDSYLNLNGKWKIEFTDKTGIATKSKIIVPFPPQSHLSQSMDALKNATKFKYFKEFILTEDFIKSRVIIHFGAVDQHAVVYINDKFVYENHGGYNHFEVDITNHIQVGANTVTVEVTDKLDINYPYGKQRIKRGGMWYTPISGIWQTVWIESVSEHYIKDLKISTKNNKVTISIDTLSQNAKLNLDSEIIDFENNSAVFEVDNPIFWSPEKPHLYNFTISTEDDIIHSYFALRDISISNVNGVAKIFLNGKPYFFHGVLDQGYYSDGIYLPATTEGYKSDILKMKELGFNMLRKHIKIEPEIFYYYCDLYGMVVFQDFVNSGKYNFIFDTALPTVFLKRGIIHHASSKRRQLFEECASKTIASLNNHPSVCYYTIFNEGWGQYASDKLYKRFKSLDSSRIWDSTSGWFKALKSDVRSEHIYFKPIKLRAGKNRPLVLSEFGGYSYKIKENSFNLSKTYGYKFFVDKNDFESALKKLYIDEIIPAIKNGLCACVLTQLSDVEDETNGLITYDRRITKVSKKVMNEISSAILSAFNNY